MKRSEAFPSQYVGKDDLPGPRVVTIDFVEKQTIKGENGNEDKAVMHFTDFPKPMILNNINWQTCEDAYGDESDNWHGKRVEMYVDPNVMFGAKRVGGVRLRLPGTSTMRPASLGVNGEVWSWPEAVQKCIAVGITEPELKEDLKGRGLQGYNAARDTATVKTIIAAKEAFGSEQQFTDADIPF